MRNIFLLSLLALFFVSSCNRQEDSLPVVTNTPPGGGSPNTPYTLGPTPVTPLPALSGYLPLGVGGGGAMSGFAMSPYNDLWFVGTDMGTLFRSVDLGKKWTAVNHYQAGFHSDLANAVSPGFASDGQTIFHASEGLNPTKSSDFGVTFAPISIPLLSGERIRYWHSDSSIANHIFAGTTKGFLYSHNLGVTWSRSSGISEEALGSFLDQTTKIHYVGTANGIWSSNDGGKNFTKYFTPAQIKLRKFTGGRDEAGMTLAFVDNDGATACQWANNYLASEGSSAVSSTIANCGFVWISSSNGSFVRSTQVVGDHLKMAENDSDTLYATGGRTWMRQYGTKIYVTHNKGQSWSLKLNQIDWDTSPFKPWPSQLLEWSAIALDVGWWDSGYESFDVHRRNSSRAGGTGYFFLHATMDGGETWQAPFTEFADAGTPAPGRKWKTRGVEVVSVYRMKFHPLNSNLVYAASADIGGMVSEDSGTSWRVARAQYNSNYDYAFDLNDDNVVYAASGNMHDWPNAWYANATTNNGGIYRSNNRGRTWTRLTPDDAAFNRQFLSVGFDSIHGYIYGGTQEVGVLFSNDNGVTWKGLNNGFPAGNKIIPQIEVDPYTGNVYALLTGDAPNFTNQSKTGIYFLDVSNGNTTWQLLRGTVNYPPDADPGYKLWYYPTAFAIDFHAPNGTSNLWLADYENKGNWLMTGIWKSTDRGATWNRMKQLTHATDVKIDPRDPNRIYASGYHQLDGRWGDGGQYHSNDGGLTWEKNLLPGLQHNARSVVIDPRDSTQLIYSYFGGGMLRGMNPSYGSL